MARFSSTHGLVAAMFLVSACGHQPTHVEKQAPAPVKVKRTQDVFSAFGGKQVPAGKPFKISSEPIGVTSVRAVFKLKKATWTVFTSPAGKEEKEYTVHILVRRGDKRTTVLMDSGETKKVLGLTLTIKKVGEAYITARQDWFPFAVLLVR